MRRDAHPRMRHEEGLSLVEMMVAVLIASFLIFGLLQVFTASKASYQTAEGLARVQENARFALDFLQRDIRMAGHFGCVNDQAHWVRQEGDPVRHFGAVPSGGGSALDFSVSIEGYEAPNSGPTNTLTLGGTWTAPTGLPTLSPAPVGGSDVLVLRYLLAEGVPATSITAGSGSEVVAFPADRADILTSGGVATPVLFGLADCSHADVFPGAFNAAGTVTTTSAAAPGLAGRYTAQPSSVTMLYRAESIVYYVGRNTAGEPALYRARAGAGGTYASEELVEGIESLQLLFGQDTQVSLTSTQPPLGNITEYGTAATVRSGGAADLANAWRRVGVVQVGILARSPGGAAAPNPDSNYRVLGTQFQPAAAGDGRYRASYEATVALRNRLFGN